MEEEKKENDKVEGMSYKHTDPETGEEKIYEVSYSQVLQKKIDEHLEEVGIELKKSNQLKKILILGLGIAIVLGALTVSNSGTVGQIIRAGFCP